MEKDVLQNKYEGFRFPDCFFEFYTFISELKAQHGIDINRCSLNIFLAEVFRVFNPEQEISHFDPWKQSRYPNDPPEFYTLLHGQSDGLHWGYYIDNENAPEIVLASYYHRDPLFLTIQGLNLHEALRRHLENCYHDNQLYLETEKDTIYTKQIDELNKIRQVLTTYSHADRKETGIEYLEKYPLAGRPGISLRYGIDMAKTEQEYRPLKDAAYFSNPSFSPTPEQVNHYLEEVNALLLKNYSLTALKLGRDLWCYEVYRDQAIEILEKAYNSLARHRALIFLKRMKEDGF